MEKRGEDGQMTTIATAPRASAYRGGLRWWTELPLIVAVYGLYTAGRLLVRGDVTDALDHGLELLRLETALHLDPERWLNSLLTRYQSLGVPADFWYASLHYLVTLWVLVWLWCRRPSPYRFARTWLLVSTLIGLLGFTLLPTAPPRLLSSANGFTDTMSRYGSYGWWGDASTPRGLGGLTNEYAAMPSLHVGWALWCGLMLLRYGRTPLVRVLGVVYPLGTTLVVMGTGNHYFLDAVAGVAVMGIGLLLAHPLRRLTDARLLRLTDARRRPVRSPRPGTVPRPGTGAGPAAAAPDRFAGGPCPEHSARPSQGRSAGPSQRALRRAFHGRPGGRCTGRRRRARASAAHRTAPGEATVSAVVSVLPG
jgi:hypothetical protein